MKYKKSANNTENTILALIDSNWSISDSIKEMIRTIVVFNNMRLVMVKVHKLINGLCCFISFYFINTYLTLDLLQMCFYYHCYQITIIECNLWLCQNGYHYRLRIPFKLVFKSPLRFSPRKIKIL